ncbi:PapG chaperone-binding domain-containing protein [Escherichia coli]|uniref:PapG chaperone-binding domain-containing protein n=3 Tax=Escherichia coli TaxID=562 RepID=UPI0013282A0F|nr:PapG chaperone-binding domain-containing protein [Escherichia coli]MWN36017.1 hypothetical protein [Escherichia coli]MWN55000.1 hypothetical protein [Escherichia coli]MWN59289.1 hypothetical protein [Escherichia coli]MWN69123.1 hypothetical protein [Escherichia coli]MWN73174.1 hypothetical protein [Escherichia coli]
MNSSFKIIKKIIFPLALVSTGGYFPSANSANTYSYLWVTTNSASGSINYSGAAIGLVTGKVNSLYTGTMSIKYVDCSTADSKIVNYRAEDRWFFIPKTVDIGGVNKSVHIDVLPSGYSLVNSDYNGFYMIKQTGSVYPETLRGSCGSIGNTYPINYTFPSFSLKVDISGLSSGSFTGVMPIRMAYAEYFGITFSDITKYSDDLAFQYSSDTEIPYSINITNKCSVLPTEVLLNHGELSVGATEDHSVSRNITITCDEAASLKLAISLRSMPRTLYSDGVGVGLGNGWDSVLKIGNSGLSDYYLTDKTFFVSGGNTLIPITSTLKKNGTVSAGNISGSIVFSLEID